MEVVIVTLLKNYMKERKYHSSITKSHPMQPHYHKTRPKSLLSTMAFEVKCHLDNASIMKRLLCRPCASDDTPPNNDNIHFVAYYLPQYTSSELYRTQILKQNNFFHNITIVIGSSTSLVMN